MQKELLSPVALIIPGHVVKINGEKYKVRANYTNVARTRCYLSVLSMRNSGIFTVVVPRTAKYLVTSPK